MKPLHSTSLIKVSGSICRILSWNDVKRSAHPSPVPAAFASPILSGACLSPYQKNRRYSTVSSKRDPAPVRSAFDVPLCNPSNFPSVTADLFFTLIGFDFCNILHICLLSVLFYSCVKTSFLREIPYVVSRTSTPFCCPFIRHRKIPTNCPCIVIDPDGLPVLYAAGILHQFLLSERIAICKLSLLFPFGASALDIPENSASTGSRTSSSFSSADSRSISESRRLSSREKIAYFL